MSEALAVLRTQNSVGIGGKPNTGRELKATVGDTARKKLADISNMPRQDRYLTQHDKLQVVPNAAKDYIEQLQKENLDLKKILAERNKLIELTGIELQKLRMHLQKVQQQNLQLAQSNSQILHELNLGKDRLKALQHELGCKNGMLKAKDSEMKEHLKEKTCEIFGNEVKETRFKATKLSLKDGTNNGKTGCTKRGRPPKGLSSNGEVQSSDQVENKRPCTRRQSASFNDQELKPAEVHGLVCHEDFRSSDQIKNKRPCTRRQSATFTHQEAQPAEDFLEMVVVETSQRQPNDKDTPSEILSNSTCLTIENESIHAPKQGTGNKRPCVRRQSDRFTHQEALPAEDCLEMVVVETSQRQPNDKDTTSEILSNSTCLTIENESIVAPKQGTGNKRPCVRRQSDRFTHQEALPAEDCLEMVVVETSQRQPNDKDTTSEILSNSTCLTIENESIVAPKQGTGNKRPCVRRQSARFKSQELNPPEGFAGIDGSINSTTTCLFSGDVEAKLGPVSAYPVQESRRSSINRPSRQAKKVQSYKEVPVNAKMRRPE